ncbi:helix-turn-helix transcriptional regulator [Actinoplanes sp. NPDC024001]|uniref:helix-turn-helix transcriptional regulator n=1 Tax=Actinoplanes sp. NPDC024001 TaxID=3154598 RepID=UPI0033FCD8A7
MIPTTRTLKLTDPDAMEQTFTAAYGNRMRFRPNGGRLVMCYQRTEAGAFALDSLMQPATLDFAIEPVVHRLVVTRMSSARLERACGGSDARYDTGDIFLMAYPDLPYTVRYHAGGAHNCVLDPAVLNRVAAAAPGRRPAPLRFTSLEPRSPRAAADWAATQAYVSGLLENQETATAPLVVAAVTQLLAAVTLATFPNTALVDPTVTDRHDASPASLRRAIAYIESHASEDISSADIAAAANVSVRAVQLAFRRHRGMTPLAYLRQVRLDAVHRELLGGDPERVKVSAVAARWGFADPSRFSALYRATYGVTPSTTLRDSASASG